MKLLFRIKTILFLFLISFFSQPSHSQSFIDTNKVKKYIQDLNTDDPETVINYIDNKSAWPWLRENTPFFECPDKDIEGTYYFRWWSFRKHIKQTPVGFVISEFLPDVVWAGKYNTINCPAGHHFYEGRWIKNAKYMDDYAVFWFRKGGDPRQYSFWAADAIYNHYLIHRDQTLIIDLLPDLIKNYEAWEQTHYDSTGLFWQSDDRDGMEFTIGGAGYRPTINAYMYADAIAIAKIADLAGKNEIAKSYRLKAMSIKKNVQSKLWSDSSQFFKVLPQGKNKKLVQVREQSGYVPWYFNLPDPKYAIAWNQLMDKNGFYAPFGPTTAEQRSTRFMEKMKHATIWNGPSWPFATTQTLGALANLLNGPDQKYVSKVDYFDVLSIYARSHYLKRKDGKIVPWVDEDLDPYTGEWIARKAMGDNYERGMNYNHSCYTDLIISGLVGLRPNDGNTMVVNPLVPEGKWDYFCLENVFYLNKKLTIIYDKTGSRYNKGKGLRIFINDKEAGFSPSLSKLTIKL